MEFSLINMNGRVYDPVLGRFLSPDPYVQATGYANGFNRYAYALNNPLIYTDPSGEFITWSLSNGGFSIGFNLTPIGIPLGAGINVGWGDGTSFGGYGEVGYRVGGTGFGSGVTVSQSLDYNFNHNSLITTTSEGAYASFGPFNIGGNLSQSYNITNGGGDINWGINAGIGIGNEAGTAGLGVSIGYGSQGLTYGLGGYFDPPRPEVHTSPISNNYGSEDGECVYLCLEEFSESYGVDIYDLEFWYDLNGQDLGVNPRDIPSLVSSSGDFVSKKIPFSACNIADEFINDRRVMMGFNTEDGAHAVMVKKIKIWPSGRYKIYFTETSPVRIAPYSSTNVFRNLNGAGFWIFHPLNYK